MPSFRHGNGHPLPQASTFSRLKRFSNLNSLCVETQCATGRAGDLCSDSVTKKKGPFSMLAQELGLCSLERATFTTKGFEWLSWKSHGARMETRSSSVGSVSGDEAYPRGIPVGVFFSCNSVVP